MMIKEISYGNFDAEVMHSAKPVLLVFGAQWCAHCKALSPVLEQLARERPDIAIYHADTDAEPALAERFSVMSIPTLFVIKNGSIISRLTGAQTKQTLAAMFD